MSTDIDRGGVFRGQIIEHGLRETKSGAQAISTVVQIESQWNEDTQSWDDWTQYDVVARGDLYVINKKGEVLTKMVESLVNYAGWSGDLTDQSCQFRPCQLVIKEEEPNEFHQDTRYRVSFINDYDRVPGAVGNVSPDRAKELQDRYGAQFRVLAGNATRNAAPPTSKPTAPKAAPKKALVKKEPFPDVNAQGEQPSGDDGIPF